MNESPSISRRHFINNGLLTLGSLGLFGLSAQAEKEASAMSPQPKSLFLSTPLDEEGNYRTPPLPYPYEALEPIIDRETMRLHHDLHFESYTKGLNAALAALQSARTKNDFTYLSYWENQLAFNGAGYVLHSLFFSQMAPSGKTEPSNTLKNILAQHFNSFEDFQSQFSAAATQVQGSGWAILAYQPLGQKLIILQAEKHQNLTQWAITPLLALDVWEHAYYLKYQNRRAEYVKAWWNVVDWVGLETRIGAIVP